MRNLHELDQYRVPLNWEIGDDRVGAFIISGYQGGPKLRIIASSTMGWDHVSVSLPNRCPSWGEMDHVKRLFFQEDETVMQLHVPPTDKINKHNFCLHLWRPRGEEIPTPPAFMV